MPDESARPTLAPPPRIALGDDVLLRAWTVDDAPLFRAALEASEAHLRPWTPWVIDGRVAGQTLHERLVVHAAAFAAGTEWVYGAFTADERTVVGGAGLYARVGPRALEVGYWLAAGRTGQGIATRASAALTAVAFTAPEVDEVLIRCEPRNVASARVPARLGYVLRDTTDGLSTWVLTRAAHEGARA